MEIFKSLQNIMKELKPVAKEGTNEQQGWRFRSIDQLYSNLHPLLAKHGVVIVPKVIDNKNTIEMVESIKYGKPETKRFTKVLLTVEYTAFAIDGSSIVSVVVGESLDNSDKATNKAMSMAFKYYLMQTFCIALEGEIDPDSVTLITEDDATQPKPQAAKPVYKQVDKSAPAIVKAPIAQPQQQQKTVQNKAPVAPVQPQPQAKQSTQAERNLQLQKEIVWKIMKEFNIPKENAHYCLSECIRQGGWKDRKTLIDQIIRASSEINQHRAVEAEAKQVQETIGQVFDLTVEASFEDTH